MLFDTNNHSQFSFDGGATTVEKSVRSAVEKGLGGICFTDHCDFYVPEMKAQFEPIVNEVFDVKAQQEEVGRVSEMVAEGAFGKAVARKFKVLKGIEVGLDEHSRDLNRNLLNAHSFDQGQISPLYLYRTI